MEFQKETIIFLENSKERYAEITVRFEGNNTYNIISTYVSENHRGEGLAEKLMTEALSFIKKHNGKIKADCSYAKKYLIRKNINFEN